MPLLNPEAYFAERDVAHTAQGDIYADPPFAMAQGAAEEPAPAGARKRPAERQDFTLGVVHFSFGVVCSYTCGFTAQPPGTQGYSHPFRLIAPIMSLGELKASGVGNNDLRKLQDSGVIQGLMWLPMECPGEPEGTRDEFRGQAAALLYRQALVGQSALDQCDRVLRLSEPAQRILIAGLIQVASPNRFDPFDLNLRAPDMADGWEETRSSTG